jgi:hypothetical protein
MAPKVETRPGAGGYSCEFDNISATVWDEALRAFDDANIYQTWAYGVVTGGERNLSRFVLRRDGVIVALALARIVRVPVLNVGVAYVRWGPVWNRHGSGPDLEVFRHALRALRSEFVVRRGLVLRLLPRAFNEDDAHLAVVLAEEGFSSAEAEQPRSQTIVMDVRPSLVELRDSMKSHWKRELKVAERRSLSIVEGTSDDLFGQVVRIHREMVQRKRFVEGNDINDFRQIQKRLPERLKMKVMLCNSPAGLCAGAVWSSIGTTSLYLFGATSNVGLKSNGSYLLHWLILDRIKQDGVVVHDLNGINPEANPGTYKFKSDLAGGYGREVTFMAYSEASRGSFGRSCVQYGQAIRRFYHGARSMARKQVSNRTI